MNKEKETFLVTGAAGFIGAALTNKLLGNGENVIGIDNLNDYYDPKLKNIRLNKIYEKQKTLKSSWFFEEIDISNANLLKTIFKKYSPTVVINLAAQAGVRYSIENPRAYSESNLIGFLNILEESRKNKIKHLIYASSSSVYGGNKSLPFNENDQVNHPISFYAATKKSNELMAHSYSHLYGIPCTGLRFFTVYGPWGRPDMAPMIFAESILKEKPIKIFNYGNMSRDFTYIDDVVEALFKVCFKKAIPNKKFDYLSPESSSSFASHRIFNIGNGSPTNLIDFIDLLELELGKKSIRTFHPMQPGDVQSTYADVSRLKKWINFNPMIDIKKGVKEFAKWYLSYFSSK